MARHSEKFTIPESIRKLSGISSVTFREISTGERMDMLAKFMDNQSGFTTALVCASMSEVDGKPVDRIEAGLVYEKAPSKLQDLFMTGYQTVNLPTEKEKADFLGSAEAIIG